MRSFPDVLLRRRPSATLAAAQLMQRPQDTPFPGDVTVLDRLLDRQAFEFDAKPDDFGEIISRDRGDAVAALVDQGDQAVIFQTAERFAQRTETDAERGTQAVQIELASRQQLAAHDRVPQTRDERRGESGGCRNGKGTRVAHDALRLPARSRKAKRGYRPGRVVACDGPAATAESDRPGRRHSASAPDRSDAASCCPTGCGPDAVRRPFQSSAACRGADMVRTTGDKGWRA